MVFLGVGMGGVMGVGDVEVVVVRGVGDVERGVAICRRVVVGRVDVFGV